jgi:restriction system protein
LGDELLRDYESFLRQCGLRVWWKDSREALAMRARLAQDRAPELPRAMPGMVRLSGLFGLAEFVDKAEPELAANAMLCAVNQAAYLLKRQVQSQGCEFLEKGGFTEKLYGARKRSLQSDGSDKSDKPPTCPNCGKPMVLRMARKGQKAGQPFWGCSGYPDCKGTRLVESQ